MSRFADADRKLTAERAAIAKRTVRRILIVDIERRPGLTPIFDQRTRGFIPVSQWTRLPSLLCFAAKWYGRGPVDFHAVWDDPAAMVQGAWDLYDQADIVVGYNQIRFDNKHLKSEWLTAGLPPPRPWKNVDLFKVNASLFGFESKSLAHLCHRLGLPGKSGHYDPVLAERCVEGDEKAQRLMRRYNVGDVRITENVYDALRPWIHNHPHVGSRATAEGMICNKCGSTELEPAGDYRAVVIEYAMYRCKGCGGLVKAGHHRRVARTQGVQ